MKGDSLGHFPLASTPAESQVRDRWLECVVTGTVGHPARLPIRDPDLDQRLLVIGTYEHVVRAGDPPSILAIVRSRARRAA